MAQINFIYSIPSPTYKLSSNSPSIIFDLTQEHQQFTNRNNGLTTFSYSPTTQKQLHPPKIQNRQSPTNLKIQKIQEVAKFLPIQQTSIQNLKSKINQRQNIKTQQFFDSFDRTYIVKFGDSQEDNQNQQLAVKTIRPVNSIQENIDLPLFQRKVASNIQNLNLIANNFINDSKNQYYSSDLLPKSKKIAQTVQNQQKEEKNHLNKSSSFLAHRLPNQAKRRKAFKTVIHKNLRKQENSKQNRPKQLIKPKISEENKKQKINIKQQIESKINKNEQIIPKERQIINGQFDVSNIPIHTQPQSMKTFKGFSRTFHSNSRKTWKNLPSPSLSLKIYEKKYTKRENIFSNNNLINPPNAQSSNKKQKLSINRRYRKPKQSENIFQQPNLHGIIQFNQSLFGKNVQLRNYNQNQILKRQYQGIHTLGNNLKP